MNHFQFSSYEKKNHWTFYLFKQKAIQPKQWESNKQSKKKEIEQKLCLNFLRSLKTSKVQTNKFHNPTDCQPTFQIFYLLKCCDSHQWKSNKESDI